MRSEAEEPGQPWNHALVALGVVYGDIGTSPLYAFRECFAGGLPPDKADILGILALIFWSLISVVAIKYLAFILRADVHGEGGVLALMTLVRDRTREGRRRNAVVLLGLFGAALLYGDGAITPAISVLSAMEGLGLAAPSLTPYVVPASLAILTLLFAIQSGGTARIGSVFGPMMLIWFVTLGLLGVRWIVAQPQVLQALDPSYAVDFFVRRRLAAFVVLGIVFLVVTGAEALYADMGHFGRSPMRRSWFAIVLPSLVVNYFGQGALLLARPEALQNPFFLMAPGWALYPLIVLATAATVIASQAVISGAFSLTMQAGQLGYSPRLSIVHTSEHRFGQVYLPTVNWALFVAVVILVLAFGSSSRLAGAYGIAVSTTMAVTTLLAAIVARKVWGWPWVGVALWLAVFLPIDAAFLGANLLKIHAGGWAPLGIGLIITAVMTTWKRGREILHRQLSKDALPLGLFLEELRESPLTRMPGAVVFMSSMEEGTPPGLFHYHRLVRALPERVVLVTVKKVFRPAVSANFRSITEDLNDGFYRVELRYGFRQKPCILEDLEEAGVFEPDTQMSDITFVLGQESLSIGKKRTMARWRKRLFRRISKNATRPGAFFGIPTSQIMELGVGIEL